MKMGDAMIVLGCAIAAGFIGFTIAAVDIRGISEAGLLLFFGAPSYFNSFDRQRHLDAAEREEKVKLGHDPRFVVLTQANEADVKPDAFSRHRNSTLTTEVVPN